MAKKRNIKPNEELPPVEDVDLYDEQKPEELQVDDFFYAVSDEFYGPEAWIVDMDAEDQEEREGIGAEGYTPRTTAPSTSDKN